MYITDESNRLQFHGHGCSNKRFHEDREISRIKFLLFPESEMNNSFRVVTKNYGT